VGVIWRRRFLFTLGNRMAERAPAADQPIDDGWIRLQPLALLQPVDKDSSNTRALVGFAGFLLNDRCKNDKLLGRTDRQIGGAPIPDLLQHTPLIPLHALNHLLAWRASPEAIALGQQGALARNVFDVADKNLTVEQAAHDLLGGQPFRE